MDETQQPTEAEVLALTRAVVKGKLPTDDEMESFEPGFIQKLRRAAAEHSRRGSEV